MQSKGKGVQSNDAAVMSCGLLRDHTPKAGDCATAE